MPTFGQFRVRETKPTMGSVKKLIEGWPKRTQQQVQKLIHSYGMPHEGTPHMLVWQLGAQWKRIVVYAHGPIHNFPRSHEDILEQTIDYKIPAEKCADLLAFNGSLIIDRTRGELTCHCDSEEMNMMALNIAHDIVQGNMTVPEARKFYSRAAMRLRMNWPEPYAEKFRFTTNNVATHIRPADPDHQVMGVPWQR